MRENGRQSRDPETVLKCRKTKRRLPMVVMMVMMGRLICCCCYNDDAWRTGSKEQQATQLQYFVVEEDK